MLLSYPQRGEKEEGGKDTANVDLSFHERSTVGGGGREDKAQQSGMRTYYLATKQTYGDCERRTYRKRKEEETEKRKDLAFSRLLEFTSTHNFLGKKKMRKKG